MLVSSRTDDVCRLSALLCGSRWILAHVTGWNDALKLIGTIRVPVVIYEHALPGIDWPEALQRLHARLWAPVVLLLADKTSAKVRHEASALGVLGVLCRPLRSESLILALEVARSQLGLPPKGIM